MFARQSLCEGCVSARPHTQGLEAHREDLRGRSADMSASGTCLSLKTGLCRERASLRRCLLITHRKRPSLLSDKICLSVREPFATKLETRARKSVPIERDRAGASVSLVDEGRCALQVLQIRLSCGLCSMHISKKSSFRHVLQEDCQCTGLPPHATQNYSQRRAQTRVEACVPPPDIRLK